jgi:hypothetical protein
MYQDNPQSKNPQSKLEAYLKLRQLDIKTNPGNLGLTVALDSQEPFGILMDLSLPQGNATIVAFISGDASFYTSTGGGVIGGIDHENVRNAARKFVNASFKYLDKMMPTVAYPLPESGKVRFYVLTPQNIFTYEADEWDLHKNELSPLYSEGHHVLTELLAITQQKKMET